MPASRIPAAATDARAVEDWRRTTEHAGRLHVRRIVDAAPPLTTEQRAKLAAILLGAEPQKAELAEAA
jgi:hypothetical protein